MSDSLDYFINAQVQLTEGIRRQQLKELADQHAPPVVVPPVIPAPTGIRKLASGVRHEYSTVWPGNIDHRALLLQYPNGFIGLHYATGPLYKMLPAMVNSGSQPRWSRKKPTVFRYLYLNELREFDVANDQSTTLRKFKDLQNINGMGESDTSEDDDHIVLCAGQYVFVYEISTDKIVMDFTALSAFDNLYLTSQNEPIVGYFNQGHVLHRRNGTTTMLTTKSLPHMDTGSDASGNPIIVYADGWRDKAHIVKKDIATGKAMDILTFDFSLAVHVSLPDHASWACISTFDPKNPNSQVQYANEVLRVGFDGKVTSLGKHGSKADVYEREPHAAVSPDGSRFIFDGNGDVYLGMIP